MGSEYFKYAKSCSKTVFSGWEVELSFCNFSDIFSLLVKSE